MNDQKNTIIAIALSAAVLIGWQYFVGMPQQVPGWAPPGSYEYIGHIGYYPNPYLTDSFGFTKLGGEQD